MNVERKHIYRVYSDGVYLGTLPNVQSDFLYTQEINTGSAELEIQISQSLDTASESVEYIETESGEIIYTEGGLPITTEGSTEIVGENGSGLLIANNNDVYVYEISDDDPNGVLVFAGYISRWSSNMTTSSDDITLTVISYGKDLKDYVFGNSAFAIELTQATYDDLWLGGTQAQTDFYVHNIIGQSFTGLSFTLTKITVRAALGNVVLGIYPTSATITLKVYSGDPLGSYTLLATTSALVTSIYPTFDLVDIVLGTGITLSSTTNYFFTMQFSDYVNISFMSGNPYANGTNYLGKSPSGWLTIETGYDLAFYLYSGTLLTDAIFTAEDPSDIVREAIDGYQTQGGIVTYSGSSITNTGLSIDYTFITATVLEIIEKARELASAGYYWFVDPATQLLTFKPTPPTATHKFLLGKHIEELSIDASIENIINVVYFTGGPVAGVNLLKKYTNIPSLSENRLNMQKLNDNRVIDDATAFALADALMDENASEVFLSDVIINAETYDIDSINLGETVAFGGFNNFVKDQILQITRLRRGTDFVSLKLGKLPIRLDSYVEQLKRDLDKQQTLDNPDTPS